MGLGISKDDNEYKGPAGRKGYYLLNNGEIRQCRSLG